VQASAVGYYGAVRGQVDERSAAGQDFAAELCRAAESIADASALSGLRFVALRFGLVFGRGGGAFPALSAACRWVGGVVPGDGEQRLAWIHVEDALQLISRAIADDALRGAVNAVAPECPSWRQFTDALAHALHRPRWGHVPALAMTRLLGEMAGLFVQGPAVRSAVLAGGRQPFRFRFPTLRAALLDLA
jgi:uncharacterized protein (TIGR01777 family)